MKVIFFILALGLWLQGTVFGGTMNKIASDGEQIDAYLAKPSGNGPFPAIVVIHEWWGLNDQIKGVADKFAAEGYTALALDLYRGKVATNPDDAHQYMSGLPEDRAIRDLKSAFKYLQSQPFVKKDKIASIGFCMGGRLSGQLALAEPQLAACVIYYGSVPTDPATLAKFNSPIIAFYGEEDKSVTPDMARKFEAEMKKLKKDVSVNLYPGAGHGFANETGKNYNEAGAKDAWSKTITFLNKNLKGM
jgi:carboxymethylenebutenolidase